MQYTKNAYVRVNRREYTQTQKGPLRPNRRLRQRKGRNCHKCGKVLIGQGGYITYLTTQNYVCLACHRKTKFS